MNSQVLWIASTTMALMLSLSAAADAARRPSSQTIQHYLQQTQREQQQLQAAQQVAIARQAAAVQAEQQRKLDMHRRASLDRREKELATRERARQRRLEQAQSTPKSPTTDTKPSVTNSDSK